MRGARAPVVVAFACLVGGCTAMDGLTLPNDGGADAPSDGTENDGAVRFCATRTPPPKFCDDFDDEAALTPQWDSIDLAASSVVVIERKVSLSPNASLFSSLVADAEPCRYARAQKTLSGGGRKSHLELAYLFDDAADVAGAVIATQQFGFAGGGCAVLFVVNPATSTISLAEQTNGVDDAGQQTTHEDSTPNVPLAAGVWHRATVDYDLDGNVKVTSDGTTVIDTPTKLPCLGGPLIPYLEIGLHCAGSATSPLRVHFDNVAFDVP